MPLVTSETNVLGTFSYTYDGVAARVATVTYPNQRCAGYTLNAVDPEVCSNGSAPQGIGKSRVCFNWNPDTGPTQVDDNGPNGHVWWLIDFIDLTTYHWTVHPKIYPGTPAYCNNQCGNVPLPNAACSTGINDAVTNCGLLSQAIDRHEGSKLQNSHWLLYQAAQNNPNNNFKYGAESLGGSKTLSAENFANKVTAAMAARELRIIQATAPETMCLVCSADCVEFWGHANCRLGNSYTGPWHWTCPGK